MTDQVQAREFAAMEQSALAAEAEAKRLREALREVDAALTADRKARRPHNARLHARVRSALGDDR